MIKQLSFRDPDGFVIEQNDKLFRLVKKGYTEDFSFLGDETFLHFSGLPRHVKVDASCLAVDKSEFEVFSVEDRKFISYPWEWTPGMLKDAAIFQLQILKTLIVDHSCTLKDATFYNIYFQNAKPGFLDYSSFSRPIEYPWPALSQFLEQFVFPLVAVKYQRFTNLEILKAYPEGIPKTFIRKILPFKSRFILFEFMMIHLYSKMKGYETKSKVNGYLHLVRLTDFISNYLKSIRIPENNVSGWRDYYDKDVSSEYFDSKCSVIHNIFSRFRFQGRLLDVGANTGVFSEIGLEYFDEIISLESDSAAAEKLYKKIKTRNLPDTKNWSPVVADITNPSGSYGWMNAERISLLCRIRSECVLALAVIHHIFFSKNIELDRIAILFKEITTNVLFVEFIRADDDKVRQLSKKNSSKLHLYTEDNFRVAFGGVFTLLDEIYLTDTRKLFIYQNDKSF